MAENVKNRPKKIGVPQQSADQKKWLKMLKIGPKKWGSRNKVLIKKMAQNVKNRPKKIGVHQQSADQKKWLKMLKIGPKK